MSISLKPLEDFFEFKGSLAHFEIERIRNQDWISSSLNNSFVKWVYFLILLKTSDHFFLLSFHWYWNYWNLRWNMLFLNTEVGWFTHFSRISVYFEEPGINSKIIKTIRTQLSILGTQRINFRFWKLSGLKINLKYFEKISAHIEVNYNDLKMNWKGIWNQLMRLLTKYGLPCYGNVKYYRKCWIYNSSTIGRKHSNKL